MKSATNPTWKTFASDEIETECFNLIQNVIPHDILISYDVDEIDFSKLSYENYRQLQTAMNAMDYMRLGTDSKLLEKKHLIKKKISEYLTGLMQEARVWDLFKFVEKGRIEYWRDYPYNCLLCKAACDYTVLSYFKTAVVLRHHIDSGLTVTDDNIKFVNNLLNRTIYHNFHKTDDLTYNSDNYEEFVVAKERSYRALSYRNIFIDRVLHDKDIDAAY